MGRLTNFSATGPWTRAHLSPWQQSFGAEQLWCVVWWPAHQKNTFFFVNYEGLRLSRADAQILTVPTPEEIRGDFSMSNVKIYDPTTAVANPNLTRRNPLVLTIFRTRAASSLEHYPDRSDKSFARSIFNAACPDART